MAEKQSFVQIVDMASGKIDRIVNLKEIEAMSAEEKLALARNKNLFVVTHRLEPIVKVELRKSVISQPLKFSDPEAPLPAEEIVPETTIETKPKAKPKKELSQN